MTTKLYAHPGEHVRILVKGSTSFSLIGTVEAISSSEITLRLDENGRIHTFPTGAIVTVEIEVNERGQIRWATGAIPPKLQKALAPLANMLLTGTGAIPKDIQTKQVETARSICFDVGSSLFDQRNRELVESLLSSLESLQRLLLSTDFEKASRLHTSIQEACQILEQECTEYPDLQAIASAAEHMHTVADRKWREKLVSFDPKPRFVANPKPTRVSIDENGEVDLRLRVRSESDLSPATNLEIIFHESPEISHLTRAPRLEVLNPGETRIVKSRAVLDHTLSFLESTVTLSAQIRYTTPAGDRNLTPRQSMRFTLVPRSQFETIPNPYMAYAGGSSVADPQMFFGRTTLVTLLVEQLREGPLGTGFALYGQKRSGKTSVVEQVRRLAEARPVIPVSVSFGVFDRRQITVAFVRSVLSQLRLKLIELIVPEHMSAFTQIWPTDSDIESRPMESLQTALIAGRSTLGKQIGWAGLRYVFLFDEFTYLYEVLRSQDYSPEAREDVREFMRQWKALLETRTFSSVIVGQDTMPLFMRKFANEFSSMSPHRLGYLDLEETTRLADKPIQSENGESRYTGYALEGVYSWTQGHPFFTQVLCDRIVSTANERRKSEITESDVDDAIESLVEGSKRLDPFRFDCLLTADNTGLVTMRDGQEIVEERDDPDSDFAYRTLSRVAELSGASNSYVDLSEVYTEDADYYVVQDLLIREVLEKKSEAVRVKMPLFAEYLRRTLS